MQRRLRAFFLAAIIALSGATAAHGGDATPLFAEDGPLEIILTGPIRDLVRNAPRSVDPYPATLKYAGDDYAIELSARGRSRRDGKICQFPPLRVKFIEKPAKISLFHKQRKLKLVTHCRKQSSYEQLYLLEYTAYKLMNILSPASFRVRPVKVTYIDSKKGKVIIERQGFFIEDVDDLAKRVDMKEVENPAIDVSQYDREALARVTLFHYMIGNLDWSVRKGPADGDCCHNGKVIGENKLARSGLMSMPYDFDYSGFVDAPYATPPEGVRVKNVRVRSYRGFCELNAETLAAAAEARARRGELISAVSQTPGISERTGSRAERYLEKFFEAIESDQAVEKNLLRHCRE